MNAELAMTGDWECMCGTVFAPDVEASGSDGKGDHIYTKHSGSLKGVDKARGTNVVDLPER